jgi:hypothetical protein
LQFFTSRCSKITRKMNLKPILNKISPWAHTWSELDVLGVLWKLAKYVIHLSKRKNWKKFIFLHISCPNYNQPIFGLKEFYKLSLKEEASFSHAVTNNVHGENFKSLVPCLLMWAKHPWSLKPPRMYGPFFTFSHRILSIHSHYARR